MTIGGYHCRCGFDLPSFVLGINARNYVGELPEFKLRLSDSDSAASSSDVAEATLCGYVVPSYLGGRLWFEGIGPGLTSFYRLVYRRGKNGSGGTLPSASARPHADDVITDSEAAKQEECRLMATEESR